MDTVQYEAWFIKGDSEAKMTLEDFLKQLENDKIVQPFVAAHELDYSSDKNGNKPFAAIFHGLANGLDFLKL